MSFTEIRSKPLRFNHPYYSITEWEGYPTLVVPFDINGQYDEQYVDEFIKDSKHKEMICYTGEFAYFGRRAIAFIRHHGHWTQFTTYGFYPTLVKEVMRYATRGILLYQFSHRTVGDKHYKRVKSLSYIRKRPYLVRTDATKISLKEVDRIETDMFRLKVPSYYWEINGLDKYYLKKFKRRLKKWL